ncbi:hypothetical protein [Dichotomicrobium thermohalophilum]|uniref:hypothetical protein n=1 Tax=Dichotomicrobium thermohalophilum TaxID=933063 RepID=UPI003CCB4FA8
MDKLDHTVAGFGGEQPPRKLTGTVGKSDRHKVVRFLLPKQGAQKFDRLCRHVKNNSGGKGARLTTERCPHWTPTPKTTGEPLSCAVVTLCNAISNPGVNFRLEPEDAVPEAYALGKLPGIFETLFVIARVGYAARFKGALIQQLLFSCGFILHGRYLKVEH